MNRGPRVGEGGKSGNKAINVLGKRVRRGDWFLAGEVWCCKTKRVKEKNQLRKKGRGEKGESRPFPDYFGERRKK